MTKAEYVFNKYATELESSDSLDSLDSTESESGEKKKPVNTKSLKEKKITTPWEKAKENLPTPTNIKRGIDNFKKLIQ